MSRKNWPTEKIFNRLLKNKTLKTYWDNIAELRTRPNQNVFNIAAKLTQATDDKSKIIGLDVLQQLGNTPRFNQKETIDLHFKLLEQPQSNKVLKSIFHGIGHNNEELTKKQIAKLVEFEHHENVEVKYALISALSGIENSKAIQLLINFTTHKNSTIRNWSTFGLGSLIETDNRAIRNALWNNVLDTDFDTKSEAIMGLALRKDIRVKNVLITALENGNIGTLILEAITVIQHKDFLPLLEMNLQKTERDQSGWREALEETISVVRLSNT